MGGNLYVRNKEDVRARLASVVSFWVPIRGDDEGSANEEAVKADDDAGWTFTPFANWGMSSTN